MLFKNGKRHGNPSFGMCQWETRDFQNAKAAARHPGVSDPSTACYVIVWRDHSRTLPMTWEQTLRGVRNTVTPYLDDFRTLEIHSVRQVA